MVGAAKRERQEKSRFLQTAEVERTLRKEKKRNNQQVREKKRLRIHQLFQN